MLHTKVHFKLYQNLCFQETVFNLLACILYLSSSSYLAYGVSTTLYYDYTRIPQFQVYPALCAVYVSYLYV